MKRILFAEDDDNSRQALESFLAAIGFEVQSVADGAAAWREFVCACTNRPFDLVITDQFMPQLNGTELLERIRSKDTSVPVLIVSSDVAVRKLVVAHNSAFLAKPFQISELLRFVCDLLTCEKTASKS